ncbi:MAG: hypothetical protein ACI81L_003504, partial [Verrucomicrobiales bacterium]
MDMARRGPFRVFGLEAANVCLTCTLHEPGLSSGRDADRDRSQAGHGPDRL